MLLQFWGATPTECAAPMAGDELLPEARLVATRAVDLAGGPEEVWPWLAQMGFGRAGWYSYDWLDNRGRPSADRIHPEWQGLTAGGVVPGGPVDFEAAIVDEPRALVLRLAAHGAVGRRIGFTLAYQLRPAGDGATRLVSRVRATLDLPLGRPLERWLLGPGDGLMVRRQLMNLERRVAPRPG